MAATVLFISATFANSNTTPSLQVQNEFNRMFAKSTGVQWESVSGFYKANFQQDGQYLTVFFNPAGHIESLSRNITVASLPLMLQKGIQDKMGSTWVSESFELLSANGTQYYVTLDNADVKTTYQSGGNNWTVYKTIRK